MKVTVEINADSPNGKRIIEDLRRYPDTVQFIDDEIVSEEIPDGYVALKDGFEVVRNRLKSKFNERK